MNAKPYVVALGAVARRALILTVGAVVPVLIDQGPGIVTEALKSHEKTIALCGVAYLLLEYVQKWAREAWKQKQGALG
jgi:hypothetical protein